MKRSYPSLLLGNLVVHHTYTFPSGPATSCLLFPSMPAKSLGIALWEMLYKQIRGVVAKQPIHRWHEPMVLNTIGGVETGNGLWDQLLPKHQNIWKLFASPCLMTSIVYVILTRVWIGCRHLAFTCGLVVVYVTLVLEKDYHNKKWFESSDSFSAEKFLLWSSCD